jgi:signal transduction histidine kinase
MLIKYDKITQRLHIKNSKNSSFIAVVIIFFVLLSSAAYVLLRDNIMTNYEKDTKILFYKVQMRTDALLSRLLYKYSLQKKILLQKHATVRDYLEHQKSNSLDVNLQAIYEKINNDTQGNPYNIYVSNKNLIIQNSTFKKDIGFNLSFAQTSFDAHFEQNITGVCTPLFETSSKQFLSYTDEYLLENGGGKKCGLLQVSYTYKKSKKDLLEIQKLISKYPDIVDVKAYTLVNGGYANYIILKDFPSYKPDLSEIVNAIENGKKINAKLRDSDLFVDTFTKDTKEYKAMYLSTISPIFDDTKILYSILLDNSSLYTKLETLNSFMSLIVILGIIAIFSIYKLRKKEMKFSEQDRFVQSSMHEIKTPLSIITLNNELRELEFGRDEYSSEIESAIKTLKTSYEDMSFTLTKAELSYTSEILALEEILRERVSYFKSIATSNHKSIELDARGICSVKMSRVELIRIIDNSLSNAIKYSKAKSSINIVLDANRLSFHTAGEPINNTRIVFNKYIRENSVIGGHGLGLSIVKDIADKYKVEIMLTSSSQEGTKFLYIFKCHTNII